MATGEHVEVVREASMRKAGRCYRKRFLVSDAGDFRAWTERERRILQELGRHPGTAVARLGPAAADEIDEDDVAAAVLRTLDAGPTVDQWATRVVLRRGGKRLDNVFEDCACWWALTRRCLLALEPLHALGFVHLDLKADNVCIPWPRAASDYPVPGQPSLPCFDELAMIDVAFSLLPGVPLPGPLPLARQPDYEYQSPRLLQALDDARRGDLAPLQTLDWRCDLFSLAALLWRYLPEPQQASRNGWTTHRHAAAMSFVRLLVEADTAALPEVRPHAALVALADLSLREPELAAALVADCTFDSERAIAAGADAVPATRIFHAPRAEAAPLPPSAPPPAPAVEGPASAPAPWTPLPRARRSRWPLAAAAAALVALLIAGAWWLLDGPTRHERDATQARMAAAVTGARPEATESSSDVAAATQPASTAAPLAAATASAAASSPTAELSSGTSTVPSSPIAPAEREPAVAEPERIVAESAPPIPAVDLAAVAAQVIGQRLPGIAEGAEQRLAPVLATAGRTGAFRPAREVRAAARAARAALPAASLPVTVDSRQARSLNEAARVAQARPDGVAGALRLQTLAFGADPFDPEVVGNLAYLHLRETPPQPERARQLALHALTLKDNRFPSGRIQDWTSFAIASALAGREADARSAWAVTLALADDLQRHCDAVVRAQAVYGDALRPSVQALLERARNSTAYVRCGGSPAPRATASPSPRSRAAAAPVRNDAKSKRAAAAKRSSR